MQCDDLLWSQIHVSLSSNSSSSGRRRDHHRAYEQKHEKNGSVCVIVTALVCLVHLHQESSSYQRVFKRYNRESRFSIISRSPYSFQKTDSCFFKKSVLCVVPLVLDITEARAATCRHNGWFSGTNMRTRAQNVLQSRRAVVVPTRSKDATFKRQLLFKKKCPLCCF